MTELSRIRLLGSPVTVLGASGREALRSMLGDGSSRTLLFCNVHMLMLARENAALAQSIEAADMVFADGVPVAWLQRRLGFLDADVLRGYEAMLDLCALSAERGGCIGLYGSTRATIEALANELRQRFPALDIAYSNAPEFGEPFPLCPEEELARINAAGLDFLFVGLGCPKQELWVAEYHDRLDCTLLAVGAAFDWLAGTSPMPPKWMERSGLGWLARLVREPRRLGKRYLAHNTRFLVAAMGEIVRRGSNPG